VATALLVLGITGVLVHAVGYFWLVVLAYREAPGAGRTALFVWPLGFLVPLMRWDEVVLKAFLLAVVGLGAAWAGFHFMPEEPKARSVDAEQLFPK